MVNPKIIRFVAVFILIFAVSFVLASRASALEPVNNSYYADTENGYITSVYDLVGVSMASVSEFYLNTNASASVFFDTKYYLHYQHYAGDKPFTYFYSKLSSNEVERILNGFQQSEVIQFVSLRADGFYGDANPLYIFNSETGEIISALSPYMSGITDISVDFVSADGANRSDVLEIVSGYYLLDKAGIREALGEEPNKDNIKLFIRSGFQAFSNEGGTSSSYQLLYAGAPATNADLYVLSNQLYWIKKAIETLESNIQSATDQDSVLSSLPGAVTTEEGVEEKKSQIEQAQESLETKVDIPEPLELTPEFNSVFSFVLENLSWAFLLVGALIVVLVIIHKASH